MKGTPWEPIPGRPGTEITTRIAPDREEREIIPRGSGEERDVRLKEFRIERQDVFDNNPTVGCPGCNNVITGGIARNHNKKCRERFEKIFVDKGDPKLLRQAKRFMADGEAREIKKDDREIPEMRDEEMEIGSDEGEDAEMKDERETGDLEGMVMTLHPDQSVRDAVWRIRDKIARAKRSKNWEDGIREMNEA